MSFFVYCPRCGADQVKTGGAEETFFCPECVHEWIEDADVPKTKPKKKKKRK